MQNNQIESLEMEIIEELIFGTLNKKSSKKSIKNNLKKILKRGKKSW